jgi:hypothetical protein
MTAVQPASTRVDRCADVVAAERPVQGLSSRRRGKVI